MSLPYRIHMKSGAGGYDKTTHIDSTPNLDCPITAPSVDDIFASPADDIDARRVASEYEIKFPRCRIPDPNGTILRSGG